MKKRLLAILLGVVVLSSAFIGCSKKEEELTESGKSMKIIEAETKEVNKNASSYLKSIENYKDENEIEVTIEIDKGNKSFEEISKEYNNECINIFDKIKDDALKVNKVNQIRFQAILSDKTMEDSNIICYKYPDNNGDVVFEIGALTKANNFKEKTQEEKAAEEAASERMTEALKNNSDIVDVPTDEGYFQAAKLLDNLVEGNTGLNKSKSSFELVNKGDKKIIKVNLIYKNEVLKKGIIMNIKNNIESALKNQCDEIDLTITQEHPMDLYECKYIDGSWNK